MAKNKLRKVKYGGPGTKVGNTLRKIKEKVTPIVNKAVTVSKAFSPAQYPGLTASVGKAILDKNKSNKLNNSLNFNNPIQEAINKSREITRNLSQPNLPDSGLFNAQSNNAKLAPFRAMGEYQASMGLGQGQVSDNDIFVSGEDETIDSSERSTGMGGNPVYSNFNNFTENKEIPTKTSPEFQRSSVSSYGGTTGSGIAGSENSGGGVRGLGIAGTQIKDPVLENLLEQYGKDAQLDINIDEIRDRNRQSSQAEIDAINAIYTDLVGRAVRTGKESTGSERAVQARSGTLASSFGQGALQTQAENTDKNIGEIENQRTQAIADIYSRSESRAMQEFTNLQNLRNSGVDGYLQAMELQKSNMEQGLDETAQYIALNGMTGDDLGIDGLKKLAKDWNTTPMAVYNRIASKRSELDNAVIEKAGAMKKAGMGEDTSSGDFGYFSKESVAMSAIPTQLRNSDAEREYYQNGIKQGLEAGMDPYDIADVLMGFNVNKKDEFTSSVRQLIGQSELAPAKIADVARNINSGNMGNALSIVENSIMARAKKETDSFVSESMTKTAIQRSSELQNKINGLDKSPIGVTKGTMENWLGKLRGKDASKIKADIVRQVAQMRKEFSGSAVTPSEEKFLAPIIPDLGDKPDVFMYKLQALGSEPLRQLNNIRQQYGMILLDDQSLNDKNIRVQDYYEMGFSAPQQQYSSTSQGGGNFSW